jgi:dephospho-CoA kinase
MRIAITGGIAEGKSTVLQALAELGFATCSADSVAREVLAQDAVQTLISQTLHLPLPIDREALRRVIGASSEARRQLNDITHPRILALLLSSNAIFTEVPLLIEGCLQGAFDGVWVVTCGLEEQRNRLEARYGSGGHVDQMVSAQLKTSVKTLFADRIIRTNGPPEHVRHLLSEAVKTLLVA